MEPVLSGQGLRALGLLAAVNRPACELLLILIASTTALFALVKVTSNLV